MIIEIRIDDLTGHETQTLVAAHLSGMHESSPAESVHALDVEKLRDPSVTFWSAWVGARQQAGGVGRSPIEHWTIAGIGALKALDADRGELKSMRVADGFRGTGVGRALLRHIIDEARAARHDEPLARNGQHRRISPQRSGSTRARDSPCVDPSRDTPTTRSRCS